MGKKQRRRELESRLQLDAGGFRALASWSMPSILGSLIVAAAALYLVVGQAPEPVGGSPGPRVYGYDVVQEYAHDPAAFTQGLEYQKLCIGGTQNCSDAFWESTGMRGESTVREVDLATGAVLRSSALPAADFGEGLTSFGDRLVQLLWLTNKIYVYQKADLNMRAQAATPLRDGWGITSDGSALIVSDGSPQLHWLDAESMQLQKSVQVTDGGRAVRYLNELEWVGGEVWANVWQTECVARIEPNSGVVKGWIMLHGLRAQALQVAQEQGVRIDVLNGIAVDSATGRVFVTGKYWPRLWEIKPKLLLRRATGTRLDSVRQQCIL